MGIEGIKQTATINTAPQFKAAEKAQTTQPETKKNGNAMLYAALAGLAVLGTAAYCVINKGKGKPKNFFTELGYKFENKALIDKEGKKFTGELVNPKTNATYTFKDGLITKSVIKPKEGNVTEIVKTYDETGKIINNTKKIKDGNYNETVTTFTREEGKTIVKKEGTKADGTKETFETLTMQKNGDKVQVTKQTLDKDGKTVQESKEWDIKKKTDTPTPDTPEPDTPNPDTPKTDTATEGETIKK